MNGPEFDSITQTYEVDTLNWKTMIAVSFIGIL